MEEALAVFAGFSCVVRLLGAQFSEASVINTINQLSSLLLLLQRNGQQSVDQEICIPPDWGSKVGVHREVQSVMLVLGWLLVLNTHVFCLCQASQELSI